MVAVEVTPTFRRKIRAKALGVNSIPVEVTDSQCGLAGGAVVETRAAANQNINKIKTTTKTSYHLSFSHLHGSREQRSKHQNNPRNPSQRCNPKTFSFNPTLVSAFLVLLHFYASNTFLVAAALTEIPTASANDVHVDIKDDIGVGNGLANPKIEVNNNSGNPCTLKNTQLNPNCHSTLSHGVDYEINGNAYNVQQQAIIETTVSIQFIQPAAALIHETTTSTTTTVSKNNSNKNNKSVAVVIAAGSETVASDTIAPPLLHHTIDASSTVNVSVLAAHDATLDDNVEVPQIPTYIRNTAMCFCIAIMTLGVIGNIMVSINCKIHVHKRVLMCVYLYYIFGFYNAYSVHLVWNFFELISLSFLFYYIFSIYHHITQSKGANCYCENQRYAQLHQHIPHQSQYCRSFSVACLYANGAGRGEHATGDLGAGT